MKYFSTFFIPMFLFIVSALGAPSDIESSDPDGILKSRPCVFQMSYFDGCNWQTCGLSNDLFGTLVGCNQHDPKRPGYTPKLEPPAEFWVDDEYLKPGRKCVVGASHYDGCQMCFCALESVPKCVRVTCEEDCQWRRFPPHESFWQK